MSFASSPLIGQQFAYAHGRIGVLQQRLLGQSDLDRLLGAADIRDAEKILTELPLTTEIEQSINETDAILSALGAWIRTEVARMSPASRLPVFTILWIEDDCPLIAYLLKRRNGLTSTLSTEPTVSMTAYNPDALRALVEDGIAGNLPDHLVTFIKTVPATGMTPEEIDTLVSQYCCNLQLSLARASGSAHILSTVAQMIDTKNIATILRLGRSGGAVDANLLLTGGSIAVTDLVKKPLQQIVDRSDLAYALPGIAQLSDAVEIERNLAHVLELNVLQMWNVPLTIEPLFAFACIAKSQLTLVRALLIGKRNGLAPQEIKTLLPPFIPASHY